jgi:hypothetical protein
VGVSQIVDANRRQLRRTHEVREPEADRVRRDRRTVLVPEHQPRVLVVGAERKLLLGLSATVRSQCLDGARVERHAARRAVRLWRRQDEFAVHAGVFQNRSLAV